MPSKGSFVSNVFEQLEDLGKSTVKSTAQAVAQPLNPVKIIEQIVSPGGKGDTKDAKMEQMKQEEQKKDKSTPLDFEKLTKKYQENDQQKLMAVRKQFNLVKTGELKAIEERKKEEQERQKKIAMEEQEKKRKQEEQKRAEQAAPAPQGKQKRGLFSPKKKAQQQHQETKPSIGKQ